MPDGMAAEAALLRHWHALLDRVVAGDPAFSRLRLASRAVLSMLASTVLLAALTFLLHPLPVTAYGLAIIIAFVGSTAVRDMGAEAQLVTRLHGGAGAVAVVFAAGLLAPHPAAAHLVFLPVIFAAVYIRRFGQRWFAVGTMAFMAYFMGDYLRPVPSDIGWIAVSVAIALAFTHIIAAILLPDDPERDFRRAVTTIDRRINLILRALVHIPAGRAPTAAEHGALQAQVAQLREVMLMAEGFLPQGAEGALSAEGPASDIALALFQLHIAVERLVRAHRHGLASPADFELLRAALAHDRGQLEGERARLRARDPEEETEARLILRLDRGRRRLEEALGPHPSPAFAAARPAAVGGGSSGAVRAPSPLESLRLPVQVTLACGLAMGAGLLVSPVRWYWAVIASFIVFNNARSRADTMQRAVNRSAGTFGGILAGTGIATLLHGHMAMELAILPVAFFFAFYYLQTSYSMMIFFLTVALALLYGLMGMFAPDLLLLRLEETVIGSAIGAAVAFLVFPIRASAGLADALARYFDALVALVAPAREAATTTGLRQRLMALSRTLDAAYAEVANAARPLGGPWATVTRYGQVRQRLLLLAGCAHWARIYARTFPEDGAVDATTADRLSALADEIAPKIAALRAARASFFAGRGRATDDEQPSRPLPVTNVEGPVFGLEVVSLLLDRALARAGSQVAPPHSDADGLAQRLPAGKPRIP